MTGTHAAWMRGAFVVLQVALSLVLLVGAGLFLRTLKNAYSVELGYRVDQILVATLNLESHGYFEGGPRGADAGLTVYEQILARVEALPGVDAASAARMTVLTGGARLTAVSMDGRPLEPDNSNALAVRTNVVSRGYFETMNIPVLRGRSFDASDGPTTPRVTIVTRSLADRLWPNEDPIGQRLRDDNQQLQIVGVVPDTIYASTMEGERRETYYVLLAQNYESRVALHVRAANNPMSLVPAIRDAVRHIDPQLAVERPQLLSDALDRTLAGQRLMATFVGLFGALALILAACGLYGVMAQVAIQRTQEIGIRLALGAQPVSIVRLLVSHGLRLLGIGTVLGLATALLATRYVEAQLFGVTATDPLTFVAGCVVLASAGLGACVLPAFRAMRVDPIIAIRRI